MAPAGKIGEEGESNAPYAAPPGRHVFELTNFVIPANTTYGSGYELGTFLLPKDAGLVIAWYIETETQPLRTLRLSLDDGPDYNNSSTLRDQALGGSLDFSATGQIIVSSLDTVNAMTDQSDTIHPAASRTMHIHLVKAVAEAAPMTVVRARVALDIV